MLLLIYFIGIDHCNFICFTGHSNNIHCLAQAINGIAGALFTICGHGDIEDRLKEFLAVRVFIFSILHAYFANMYIHTKVVHYFGPCDC